jgi:hypothetical protein
MNKHTANFISTAVITYFDHDEMTTDRDAVEAAYHIVADWKGYNNYGIRRRMNTLSKVCPELFELANGIKIQAIGNENNGEGRWYMYGGGIKEHVMDFFENTYVAILNGEVPKEDYEVEWKNQVVEYMAQCHNTQNE